MTSRALPKFSARLYTKCQRKQKTNEKETSKLHNFCSIIERPPLRAVARRQSNFITFTWYALVQWDARILNSTRDLVYNIFWICSGNIYTDVTHCIMDTKILEKQNKSEQYLWNEFSLLKNIFIFYWSCYTSQLLAYLNLY